MNRTKSEAVKVTSFQDLGKVFKTAHVAPSAAPKVTLEQRPTVCPACGGTGKAYVEACKNDTNQLSML